MTRENVQEIMKCVTNAVTRNRLISILDECKTIDEFANLSNSEALAKYRQTEQGKAAKYDLGTMTYSELARIQSKILGYISDEKRAERAAQKAENWFTKDEVTVIAAFMDSFGIEKIELTQIRKIIGAVKIAKPVNKEAQKE